MDNRQHNQYVNTAELFDLDDTRNQLTADLPFYLEYANQLRGPVLDLGYGTGRVALALAQAGHRVTGLDISDAMLAVFRRKVAAAAPDVHERIEILQGDMADFRLNRRYALVVIPFRSFQALTADKDIRRCLLAVRDHLADGGRFIVNVFRPRRILDESWCYPESVEWERDDPATGRHIVKRHRGERIDTARQLIHPSFTFEITEPDGRVTRAYEPFALRYWYREQLSGLLSDHGFNVLEEYGGYDKGPIESGREQIMVCSRRVEGL